MPHSYPIGIPHVAVNGVLVIENGAFTGQTPGQVVRGFDD
jgi:N-acyl-D-amino-acid deacylase